MLLENRNHHLREKQRCAWAVEVSAEVRILGVVQDASSMLLERNSELLTVISGK